MEGGEGEKGGERREGEKKGGERREVEGGGEKVGENENVEGV